MARHLVAIMDTSAHKNGPAVQRRVCPSAVVCGRASVLLLVAPEAPLSLSYQVPKEVGRVGKESPTFIEPVENRKDGIHAMFSRQQLKTKTSSSAQTSPVKRQLSPSPEAGASGSGGKRAKVEEDSEEALVTVVQGNPAAPEPPMSERVATNVYFPTFDASLIPLPQKKTVGASPRKAKVRRVTLYHGVIINKCAQASQSSPFKSKSSRVRIDPHWLWRLALTLFPSGCDRRIPIQENQRIFQEELNISDRFYPL
jgi:hypothetical protein